MKPLLFDPDDGSLTRGRTVSIEDNSVENRNVSNPSSKGKYTDPRPDSTAKDRSQHDGNGARAGRRRHNDGYTF